MVAKIGRERHEVLQLLGVRIFMDSIQERNLQPVEMLRHRLIGRQHEFLDDLLRNRALSFDNINGFTVLVYDNLALLEVEIHRAPVHAGVTQLHRQLAHELEVLDQRRIALQQLRVLVHQDFTHIGIRHPLFRTNHACKNIMLHDLQILVEFHRAGHRQPVHLRIERADAI
ncbi:hypothetical protein D3C73_1309500 [compost metagenome]